MNEVLQYASFWKFWSDNKDHAQRAHNIYCFDLKNLFSFRYTVIAVKTQLKINLELDLNY